jgi:hypothetical protein
VAETDAAARSLFTLGRSRRRIYILPLRGVAYGMISLAILVAIAVFFDRLLLDWLERRGWIAGRQWARHNALVEENHRRKTTTGDCEARQWNGQPLPSDTSRRKILVLGDSFVWGPPYITLNHLWWRQLQIELERRGYHGVDVLAVGKAGWSTHAQLDCARDLIPQLQPDLVIWGYVTNDSDEKVVRQINDTAERLPYGERARRLLKRLVPNLEFKFEALRSEKLAMQYTGPIYGYAYPDWELKLLEGDNFEHYRKTIGDAAALIEQSQVPAFLMTLPHFPSREYFEPRYAPVLKGWRAAGVTVLNTLDEFIRRYGDVQPTGPEAIRWGIDPADSHPGPKATHFYAVMAADFIERHWPEALGAKDLSPPQKLAVNDWLPFDLKVRPISEQTFELDYPATTPLMPRLPLDEPTALVALRYPLPLRAIALHGDDLKNVHVWVSVLHSGDSYDENDWHQLKTGENGRWRLPPELAQREVATIRFRADIAGSNRRVQLTLVRGGTPAERL